MDPTKLITAGLATVLVSNTILKTDVFQISGTIVGSLLILYGFNQSG